MYHLPDADVKNAAKRPHGRLRLMESQEPCHGLNTCQVIVQSRQFCRNRSLAAVFLLKIWANKMVAYAAASLFFEQNSTDG
jgi:hypothetical protein